MVPRLRLYEVVGPAVSSCLLEKLFVKGYGEVTSCDAAAISNPSSNFDVDDSYPNFSRHGTQSLLKKYLTPQVFQLLRDRKTSSGVTLEDMIQSGVSLPFGAKPPRGVGLYAGDAECYTTFAPLLDPLIAHYHDTSTAASSEKKQRLKRQVTLLRPDFVLSQRPDPTGEYILYTRMRVARSLTGFPFATTISRSDRRKIEKLLCECVQDWRQPARGNSDEIPATLRSGKYISVYEMSNEQHDDLIQRHILFHDPDEWALIANLGRDWPDARGLYCSDWNEYLDPFANKTSNQNPANTTPTPQLMIWCNAEDHIRIISMNKGGDLRGVFTTLVGAVQALERSLERRGHGFCYHPIYGFLNTSPTNIGTALRASVFVKLVRLGQQPGFANLIQRLKLEAHTRYAENDKRYTGIFDVSNAERFGKNETKLINIMIQGVHRLIELEKKLERGEQVNLDEEG